MSHAVTATITVMVADDDVAVANAATKVLRKAFRVVPPVTDLALLEAALEKYRPDVLFLDIMWASVSILAQLPALRRAYPAMRICMLSAHAASSFVAEAMGAGACGYLTKLNMTEELVPTVGMLVAGGQYLSQELRDAVGIGPDDRYPEKPIQPLTALQVGSPVYVIEVAWLVFDLRLSPRQAEVALAVRSGLFEKQIGSRIGCSSDTVHTHARDGYSRLRSYGVTNQATMAVVIEQSLRRRPSEWQSTA